MVCLIEIKYVITDELGLHARPAGMLVKRCSAFNCDIKIGTAARMVDAKRIMGVMSLAVKHGQEVTLTFDGTDATEALEDLKAFLKENL
jgi:phosphocarrier protein